MSPKRQWNCAQKENQNITSQQSIPSAQLRTDTQKNPTLLVLGNK